MAAFPATLRSAAGLAASYLLAAVALRLLYRGSGLSPAFAAEAGIALGLCLRRGGPTPADAASLLAAELLASLVVEGSPTPSELLAGSARALAVPVVALLLGRLGVRLAAGEGVREYLGFLAVAGLLPAVVAATVAILAGARHDEGLTNALALASGTLLFAPAVARRPDEWIAALSRTLAPRHVLLLLAVAAAAAAFRLEAELPAFLLAGGVLVWSGLYLGLPATALLGAVIWLSGSLSVAAGAGELGLDTGSLPAPAPDLLPFAVVASLLAVAVDQERRLGELALTRARELEALVRALPDRVLRLDPEGRVLDCRAAQEDGLPPPQACLGRRLDELLPDAVSSLVVQALARARASPEVVSLEFTLPGAGGLRCHLEMRVSAIGDGCLVALLRDVTERARAEAELRARARALARSNAELEQFAYIASHDLQEPLRTVAGFCELLARRYGDRLDDAGREFVRFAVDGARRMQSLIRDLLDLSRIATRGRPFEAVDARAVLERVLEDLKGALEASDGRVEVRELPTVRADPTQLHRLFANLLANALKYRSDRPPQVRVWAERRDDGVLFHVEDNGLGIPEEFREQIFEPFRRLHSREDYPGNGIGLAICRKIVQRHGGWITVRSRAGRGSDFCFWLPDEPPQPEDAGGLSSLGQPPRAEG